MAIVTSFNTLAYSKRLIEAGVPQKQAEAQAEALLEVVEEKLVSKPELETEIHDIRHMIEKLDEKFDRKFSEQKNEFNIKNAELKNDVIKWVIGISTAQTTVTLSLFISLFKIFH